MRTGQNGGQHAAEDHREGEGQRPRCPPPGSGAEELGRAQPTGSERLGAVPSGSVQSMFPAKKDDQEHDPAKAMGEPGDGGGEVSQGPSSFGNSETATGGADSVPGTPDATPSVALGDRDVPESPGAS